MKKVQAAVIGASGYSGAELVKILAGHQQVDITAITSTRHEGNSIADFYPNFTGNIELKFGLYTPNLAADNDVVFLALPHGKAMEFAPALMKAGAAKIIDVSGDFRLPAPVYESWYKQSHTAPDLALRAVYGLSEINKTAITEAALVANPGCYPTGIILAAAAALSAGLAGGTVTANSLSGISGAGRALSEASHFCGAESNATAYKVGGVHQHIPEIEQSFATLTADAPDLVFTPHLAPFSRGIYSTVTFKASRPIELEELHGHYVDYYAGKAFVKILTTGTMPQVKAVAGSNYCHIGLAVDERTGYITVVSAIDNLVKGAAGQAVQNMNLIFGLDETAGLTQIGLYP